MKRVLLVSAVFPPQLGGTSEKMAKRAKYFFRFGWQTVVLAPAIPPDSDLDETLMDELADIEIHRTKYFFQSRWPSLRHDKGRSLEVYQPKVQGAVDLFFVPKGYVRWFPFALQEGRRLVASADVILTMNNPMTLHLLGFVLHKLTGKPWVAEMRDPIAEYAYGRRGPERLNYRLERLIVQNADAVVQREDFVPELVGPRYPDLSPTKFTVIPFTGYDPDDFALFSAAENKGVSDDQLMISYTGSFYGETITPVPFLRGLHRFLSANSVSRSCVRAVFAGDWDARYDQVVDELDLLDCVEYRGRLTRPECIRLWLESSVLLLILGSEEDNLLRIPSKFWDYLGAGRVILALVHPEGRTAQVLREQHLGFAADTDDEVEIAATLKKIWQAYQRGVLKPQPTAEFVSKATRASSEKAVVDVLNQVVSSAH